MDVDLERVRRDLGERGFVALAVGRGPGVNGDFAARLDPGDGCLESTGAHDFRWPERADLDVAGESDPAQLALLAQLRGLRFELLEAGDVQRLVERSSRSRRCRKTSPVGVVYGNWSFLMKLSLRTSAASSPRSSAIASIMRSWKYVASGTASAAIGIRRHLVGEDAVQVVLQVREQVRPGAHQRGEGRDLGGAVSTGTRPGPPAGALSGR